MQLCEVPKRMSQHLIPIAHSNFYSQKYIFKKKKKLFHRIDEHAGVLFCPEPYISYVKDKGTF